MDCFHPSPLNNFSHNYTRECQWCCPNKQTVELAVAHPVGVNAVFKQYEDIIRLVTSLDLLRVVICQIAIDDSNNHQARKPEISRPYPIPSPLIFTEHYTANQQKNSNQYGVQSRAITLLCCQLMTKITADSQQLQEKHRVVQLSLSLVDLFVMVLLHFSVNKLQFEVVHLNTMGPSEDFASYPLAQLHLTFNST